MLSIQTGNQNEILRKISEEIQAKDYKKYIKLGKEMIKYIKNPKNSWVWLAGPQVWYNKRIIVVSLLKNWEDKDFSTIMMINPKILDHSLETNVCEEWCLSLPWEKWKVERYNSIKISYKDNKIKDRVLILGELSSRIVQHEIDHLDWILFTDKIFDK